MDKNNKLPAEETRPCPEEMPTMMLLNDVSKLFHDKLRGYNESVGVPDGFRRILFELRRGDGKTQLEISRMTHLKAPTVSVALQKMELAGLVERKTDEEDMRQSRVFITDKGREIMGIVHSNLKKAEKITLEPITPEEEEQLKTILLKMRKPLIEEE